MRKYSCRADARWRGRERKGDRLRRAAAPPALQAPGGAGRRAVRQLFSASGTGMPSVVSTSAALVLTAVPFVVASIRLPLLADWVAAVHCCVISSRPDLAEANFSAVRLAGSFLLFERMSTRPLIASSTFGMPVLKFSHAFVSSAFLALAALATSFALSVRLLASLRAAVYSPLANFSLIAASAASRLLAWSGTYLLASATVALTAFSAVLIAASAGPLSPAQPARIGTLRRSATPRQITDARHRSVIIIDPPLSAVDHGIRSFCPIRIRFGSFKTSRFASKIFG